MGGGCTNHQNVSLIISRLLRRLSPQKNDNEKIKNVTAGHFISPMDKGGIVGHKITKNTYLKPQTYTWTVKTTASW